MNTYGVTMYNFGRWDGNKKMFGRLVCDMPECLNKTEGTSHKTAYFKDLGPVVEVGSARKHIRCVVAKTENNAIFKETTQAVDPD